jgi:hypothetical protein
MSKHDGPASEGLFGGPLTVKPRFGEGAHYVR